jgi:CNT family concentrative nucleoside transporter
LEIAPQILASQFIETEALAYFSLASIQATNSVLTIRSMTILIYSLCGFVHISSMEIFLDGLSALVPYRAHEISLIGFQALWTSFLATLLTECIAGSLVLI